MPVNRTRNEIDVVVGVKIRQAREGQRILRDDLAKAIDLTDGHLGLIEAGDERASIIILIKAAVHLSVQPSEFLPTYDDRPVQV